MTTLTLKGTEYIEVPYPDSVKERETFLKAIQDRFSYHGGQGDYTLYVQAKEGETYEARDITHRPVGDEPSEQTLYAFDFLGVKAYLVRRD